VDTNELSFDAWILIGNVLNALLRGAAAHAGALDRSALSALDDKLQILQPPQMLSALRDLTPRQRDLLREACEQAFAAAGTEDVAVLGLSKAEAQPVLDLLAQPH
jgi:hypothetical protein